MLSNFSVENLINKMDVTDQISKQFSSGDLQSHKFFPISSKSEDISPFISNNEPNSLNSIQCAEILALLQSRFCSQDGYKTNPLVDVNLRETIPNIPTIYAPQIESFLSAQGACLDSNTMNTYFHLWKNFLNCLNLMNNPTLSEYYQQILAAQWILSQQGSNNPTSFNPTSSANTTDQYPTLPVNLNPSSIMAENTLNSIKQMIPNWPFMQQSSQISPAHSSNSGSSTLTIPTPSFQTSPTEKQKQKGQNPSMGQSLNEQGQHSETQQSSKGVVCPVCGKSFNAQYNLARHAVIHSGARPFLCKVLL